MVQFEVQENPRTERKVRFGVHKIIGKNRTELNFYNPTDEPQAQRSRETSRTRSEAHVSEVSEGQPGGTERAIEVQHLERDGDHTTIAPSNSRTIRPARDES